MTQLDRIEQMVRQQIESTGAAVTATAGVTTGPTGPAFAQGTGPRFHRILDANRHATDNELRDIYLAPDPLESYDDLLTTGGKA